MVVISAPEESNFEEEISITVEGLKPKQKITVVAMVDRYQTPVIAFANYDAAEGGLVDLNKANALPGGTYAGHEPMGLFWSLQAINPLDLSIRVLSGFELDYLMFKIRVVDGHHYSQSALLANIDRAKLAELNIKRMFITGGIKRALIKYNKFRGVLFLPEGDGPFPAIIDIVSFASGIFAFRGSLFARNGFACLHVIYEGFEDLPKLMKIVDYEYFVEAYNFLAENPMISKDNIGFYGCCAAGTISLAMARCLPNVKAVVAVQSAAFAYFYDYKLQLKNVEMERQESIVKIEGTSIKLKEVDVDGEMLTSTDIEFKNGDWRNHSLEMGEIKASLLLFYSKDDAVVNPNDMLPMLREQFDRTNKQNVEIVVYEKGGHWLQPPYFWGPRKPCYKFWSNLPYFYGGDQAQHSHAQGNMWQKTVEFFHKHLISSKQIR